MQPCRIEWITVPAPDLEAASVFYNRVFGFTITEYSSRFRVFRAGNLSGGLDQDLEVTPAGIGFSITVSDLTATLRLVAEHGGKVVTEPYSLGPGAGSCARFADPNGNVLEVYASADS